MLVILKIIISCTLCILWIFFQMENIWLFKVRGKREIYFHFENVKSSTLGRKDEGKKAVGGTGGRKGTVRCRRENGGCGENTGLRVQSSRYQFYRVTTCTVTLGKPLPLFVPQFPLLSNELRVGSGRALLSILLLVSRDVWVPASCQLHLGDPMWW
jgi:hypothetical protein